MKSKDLLNRPLSADESELFDLYERLKKLSGRTDLAPCVLSNARFATAALWQIVNDLQIEWEHLYDIGV